MNQQNNQNGEQPPVRPQTISYVPDPLNVPHNNDDRPSLVDSAWPTPSGSLHAMYKRAAVATDHGLCSEIGREMAPRTANSTMYKNNPEEAVLGWKSIGTPGELHGYWTVFTRYGSGRIAWKDLVDPSIKLARNGFPVSSNLAMVFEEKESFIMADENMKKAFTDPRTGRVYEEGDIMKRPLLADTLEEIAQAPDPVHLFYQGGIAQTIAAEMKEHGGYLTLEDLTNYKTIVYEAPLESDALPGDLVMCGPPPPSSFAVTQAIVGIMARKFLKKSIQVF
uniref:Uncharacterized protein n=1 Tax=Panagrolaimus sp. PS1159 TaxID=55785 RepID=A0AC35FUQ5_9BILA